MSYYTHEYPITPPMVGIGQMLRLIARFLPKPSLFQKINHFPGMSEICRKDLLARNMNRMLKTFPKEYNVFPKTWCLPAE